MLDAGKSQNLKILYIVYGATALKHTGGQARSENGGGRNCVGALPPRASTEERLYTQAYMCIRGRTRTREGAHARTHTTRVSINLLQHFLLLLFRQLWHILQQLLLSVALGVTRGVLLKLYAGV